MTEEEMVEFFDANSDLYLEFEKIPEERRLSNRPDLNAFLILDKLSPAKCDIVAGAEHDEIYLDASSRIVAENATEEQILDLIRSGIRYDDLDGFRMFA